MKLNYKKLGEGPPLLILHGLFGMLDNWISLGKRYAQHFEVYLIDQRNHGKSPHCDEFTFADLADDLMEFIENHHIRGALMIGHSLGGKTLIEFANEHACFIEKMVIADIGPKAYKPRHENIVAAMESLDLQKITSRKAAEEALKIQIPNLQIRQFLLKNIYWLKKNELGWKINLPVIKQNLDEVLVDMSGYRIIVPTLFLRGGDSDYILPEDEASIKSQFPNGSIVTIPGTGHWLHAEKQDEFYRITMNFFNSD
jgi:pimeloyl-ACP methyl ester carboxylesterase